MGTNSDVLRRLTPPAGGDQLQRAPAVDTAAASRGDFDDTCGGLRARHDKFRQVAGRGAQPLDRLTNADHRGANQVGREEEDIKGQGITHVKCGTPPERSRRASAASKRGLQRVSIS